MALMHTQAIAVSRDINYVELTTLCVFECLYVYVSTEITDTNYLTKAKISIQFAFLWRGTAGRVLIRRQISPLGLDHALRHANARSASDFAPKSSTWQSTLLLSSATHQAVKITCSCDGFVVIYGSRWSLILDGSDRMFFIALLGFVMVPYDLN